MHTQTQRKAFHSRATNFEGNADSSPTFTSLIKQVDLAGENQNQNQNQNPPLSVFRKESHICRELPVAEVCLDKRHDKWALSSEEWQLSVARIIRVSQLFNGTELPTPCLLGQVKGDS